MTVNLKINLRPAAGPFKSPKEIAQFYNSIDGWQESLPKTDNTYSPKSKYYKYEVSPGIRFIPNMSRSPLKSYEKTPMKLDFSEDQSETFLTSSHIKRKLFKSTTYQHYNIINHQTHSNETRTVYQSAQIFVNLLISYFISITEVHGTVMEVGSNLINTTMQKITNWAHLFSINMVYLDLLITIAMRKVVDQYFGHTRLKNLLLPILLSVLILFLTVGFLKYATYLDIPVWQDSWTNFLLSPFISILNLISSIYQTFTSTISFVLDLISVTCASSIIVFKLCGKIFVNVFHNIDTVIDSAGHHVSTIPSDQNSRLVSVDYNLLAKK